MLARKISASSAVSAGRKGRRPAGALREEGMAEHPPLQGEGRTAGGSPGGGDTASPKMLKPRHPLPARKNGATSPPHGGGGFPPRWSSPAIPWSSCPKV